MECELTLWSRGKMGERRRRRCLDCKQEDVGVGYENVDCGEAREADAHTA